MPMSLQEILDRQNELAEQFENFDPTGDDRDPEVFRRLLGAAAERAKAESEIAEAVAAARQAGYSWAAIGGAVGTTGQAAQQRYGDVVARSH